MSNYIDRILRFRLRLLIKRRYINESRFALIFVKAARQIFSCQSHYSLSDHLFKWTITRNLSNYTARTFFKTLFM